MVGDLPVCRPVAGRVDAARQRTVPFDWSTGL